MTYVYNRKWRDPKDFKIPDNIKPVIRFKSKISGNSVVEDLVQGKVIITNSIKQKRKPKSILNVIFVMLITIWLMHIVSFLYLDSRRPQFLSLMALAKKCLSR